MIAQKIEADFVGRRVGHRALIGPATVVSRKIVRDESGRDSQKPIDASHPLGIAPRQIIVGGEDVDRAIAGHRRDRQHGGQRLPFPGLHFGNGSAGDRHRAEDLFVVRPQSKHSLGRDGGFGESVFSGFQLFIRM